MLHSDSGNAASVFFDGVYVKLWRRRQDHVFHLITLSALASTFGGIVRPICLAAFRLITNSNLVGCSTGRSAGLAPFKILSTIKAARLEGSNWSAPYDIKPPLLTKSGCG